MNNTQTKKIYSATMRRVWYTYALSLTLRQSTIWGIAFGASLIGFWKLVSVTSIIKNFLNVPVKMAPSYIMQSILQAEFLVLLAFGVIVFTVLSVGLKMTIPILYRSQKLSSV